MPKALISIDYTVDFVADEGQLTAGAPAQAISEAIAQVTESAFDRGDYIFFAIDAHDESCFHLTISKGPAVAIFMVLWLIFMTSIKQTLGSFGWINAIILPFPVRI